jgi:hypothetical protein
MQYPDGIIFVPLYDRMPEDQTMTDDKEYEIKILEIQHQYLQKQKEPLSLYEAVALWLSGTVREDRKTNKNQDDNYYQDYSC